MYVRQQPQETVHHFWARFLLVKNNIKDCCDDDAISVFRNNCTDEGILNALNCHRVPHFADLVHIVQKYWAMESAWKTQTARWELQAFKPSPGRAKRMHPRGAPDHHPVDKKIKPFIGHRIVFEEWLDRPCQIHTTLNTEPTHSLRACWILRQVAKSGEGILTNTTPEKNSSEGDDLKVFTVSETFSSND